MHLVRRIVPTTSRHDQVRKSFLTTNIFDKNSGEEVRKSLFVYDSFMVKSWGAVGSMPALTNALAMDTLALTAQYQCAGRTLLIARADQALEIEFADGHPKVTLWRRLVGSPIGEVELTMISDLVVQVSTWLHATLD